MNSREKVDPAGASAVAEEMLRGMRQAKKWVNRRAWSWAGTFTENPSHKQLLFNLACRIMMRMIEQKTLAFDQVQSWSCTPAEAMAFATAPEKSALKVCQQNEEIMTSEIIPDELDARLAETAARMLKTFLQVARIRNPDQASFIDGLNVCTLMVKANGPQIQIELLTPIEGGTVALLCDTFEEQQDWGLMQ